MRMVLDYLKEADSREVVNAFMQKHPDRVLEDLEKFDAKGTGADLIEQYKQKGIDFLKSLQELEVAHDDDESILYLCKVYDAYNQKSKCEMTTTNSLKEKGVKAETYDFSDAPHNEVIGYYVSDDAYTQEHITDVLAEVLYENSWFGYKHENVVKEIEEQELSKMEEALKNHAQEAGSRYYRYHREKALMEIMNSLGIGDFLYS